MSEILDVIPGGDVESTWGNLIKDRTLMRYASQAALNASILTPDAGDFAYVQDEQAVKVWTGAAWDVLLDDVSGGLLYLPLAGGTMSGTIVFERTGVGMINMIRTDAPVTDGNAQSNLRQSTADGFVIRTGSPDNITVPLTDRVTVSDELFEVKNVALVSLDATSVQMQNLELGDAAQTNVRTLDIFRTTGAVVASARFAVTNDASNLGAVLIRATQDGGTTNMYFGQDGLEAQIVDDLTTATAANVNVDANGLIRRSTSARKYKTDIKKLVTKTRQDFVERDLPAPVSFKHKGDKTRHIGFIADEVAEYDERLGEYRDGEVENFDLRGVVAVLAAQVTDLRTRLAAVEAL